MELSIAKEHVGSKGPNMKSDLTSRSGHKEGSVAKTFAHMIYDIYDIYIWYIYIYMIYTYIWYIYDMYIYMWYMYIYILYYIHIYIEIDMVYIYDI